jgi:hypothetical protein
VFYNHSYFDGGFAGGAARLDDLAIAPDKQALLPGQRASFANLTSYSRGLNGIMVDVANLPGAADFLTPADVVAQVGNGPALGEAGWSAALAPSELFIRRNGGAEGSDRLVLVWPDGAIKNTWLRLTLPAGGFTGLGRPDVFYFGNLIGETGDVVGRGYTVTAMDMAAVNRASYPLRGVSVGPDNPYDIDRNRSVGLIDRNLIRLNVGHSLPRFAAPRAEAPSAAAVEPVPVTSDVLIGRRTRRGGYFAA